MGIILGESFHRFGANGAAVVFVVSLLMVALQLPP
jgi:hypothetical protein